MPAAKKKTEANPGDTVRVQLYDGRTVVAVVCQTFDTVAGRKLKIIHGSIVNTIRPEQVVQILDRK